MPAKFCNSGLDKKIYTDLLNILDDIIILADTDGNIILINNAACRLLKSKPEQLMQYNIIMYLSDSEREYLNALLKTGLSQHFEQFKNENLFSCNYFPILNELNQISYILIYIKDITKIRKLEDIIINALELKERENGFNKFKDIEQDLTGISYLLNILLKKVCSGCIPEETLVCKISDCNREVLEKLKKPSI